MRNLWLATSVSAALVVGSLSLGANPAAGAGLVQTNLVSDIPKLAAVTDPLLRNPWGFSHGSSSPFWISNQLTNTTTFYAVTDKTKVSKVGSVKIPKTATSNRPVRSSTATLRPFR